VTLRYTLTRIEIVRSYFQSLAASPKFLAMILIYSAAMGVFLLVVRGAFSRPLRLNDVIFALAWMLGVFSFMPLWLFIRGKTSERTLSISANGISTEIGSLKGQVPWGKVKIVTDARQHVLIVGTTGNAFIIPSRAFQGPDQRAQFIEQIQHWRGGK